PPRGDAAVPGRSDAPPVLAADVQGPPEASPAALVASPVISHAFTTQSALPGVSEEALRDIADEVATAASDRNLAISATQLASVTKFLVRAMVQCPRSNDQGFWDQFNRAQTVEEVGSAITAGTEQVYMYCGGQRPGRPVAWPPVTSRSPPPHSPLAHPPPLAAAPSSASTAFIRRL
ncbi:hypothetical protein JG688_00014982, partial [Phytophthora aleatoria]